MSQEDTQVEATPAPSTQRAWAWDKDFREVSSFDFSELDQYVIRPTEDGPEVWCGQCGRPISEKTNKLRVLIEQTMTHHRATHPRQM